MYLRLGIAVPHHHALIIVAYHHPAAVCCVVLLRVRGIGWQCCKVIACEHPSSSRRGEEGG